MRQGIEAVLWDIGGVLTASPFEAFNQFEAANGFPPDFIRGVNATNAPDVESASDQTRAAAVISSAGRGAAVQTAKL